MNITRCLEAIGAIADVVIVDSFSTDETLRLAETARPDVRVFSHAFEDFGDQRNWALSHCAPRYPWVLFVDADEYCTPAFLEELAAFAAAPGGYAGAFVAGKSYFLGRWVKYSSLYPSYQLRLLRLGQVRYRKEGHGQKEVTDRALCYFTEGWRHEGFSKGVHQWIERQNRYGTEEVGSILELRKEPIGWRELFSHEPVKRRRCLKRIGAKLPLRPLVRFCYVYVLKKGFLDGLPGLLYCLLYLCNDIHLIVKIREQRYRGNCEV